MWLYTRLSFIKKYSSKLLFIAFLGVHIPLLGIIAYILSTRISQYTGKEIILVALLFTLLSCGLTLYFLNKLTTPLKRSKDALEKYSQKGELPNLPVGYNDEAGILMQQVQNTIEKFDKLLNEKKDILALASHDLRSPATQIQGLAHLIRITNDAETTEQYIQLIENLCSKQITLLENLITLLRSDDDFISADKMEEISVKALIDSCIQLNEVLMNTKQIKYEIDLPSEPVIIKADRVLLTQAIQNLINNAIKYSEKGETIHITLAAMPGYAKLIIKDNGLGFTPDSADLLFNKFTTKRKKGTYKESTTGLGLYLTKRIISQHNGEIEAHSEGQNKGATFTVTIPA